MAEVVPQIELLGINADTGECGDLEVDRAFASVDGDRVERVADDRSRTGCGQHVRQLVRLITQPVGGEVQPHA
jgi:hypothetical protein